MKALLTAHTVMSNCVLGILRCSGVAALAVALLGRAFFGDELWTVDYWLPELVIFVTIVLLGLCALNWSHFDVVEWAVIALWTYCSLVDLIQGCFGLHTFLWHTAMLCLFFIMRRFPQSPRAFSVGVAVLTVVCALHLIALHYGLLEHPLFNNSSGYAVAMACGMQFLVGETLKRKGFLRGGALFLCGAVLWSLWLAASRAAWFGLLLAMVALCVYKIWPRLSRSLRYGITSAAVVSLLAALVALYSLRPTSANGRLLIYRVSADCIADAPLFGHGSYGVLRDYMPAQGDYLVTHPQSQFESVAGNTPYVFNEVLNVLFKYGVVGLLLVIVILGLLLRGLRSSQDAMPRWGALIAFCGVSLFSYPTAYPYLCLLLLSVVTTVRTYGSPAVHCSSSNNKYRRALVSLVGLVLLCCVTCRFMGEVRWHEARGLALCGKTASALSLYVSAMPLLMDSPEFLYNYAAELNVAGEYAESNEILRRCTKWLNDYDTELLAADNALALHQYTAAEKHLHEASEMIPSRFMPLYGLLQVYEECNDIPRLRQTARQIVMKPVKVNSPDVEDIKNAAREVLRHP